MTTHQAPAEPIRALHVVDGLEREASPRVLMDVLRHTTREQPSMDFLVHTASRAPMTTKRGRWALESCNVLSIENRELRACFSKVVKSTGLTR